MVELFAAFSASARSNAGWDCTVVVTVETVVDVVAEPLAGTVVVTDALPDCADEPFEPNDMGFSRLMPPLALTPRELCRGVIARVTPDALPDTSLTFMSATPDPPLLTLALAPGASEMTDMGPKSTGDWLA